MIRYDPLPAGIAGHLRWDRAAPDDPMPDYHAICTVVWRTTDEIYMLGMMGELSRRDWRDLLVWMRGANVRLAICRRAPGHLAPFAEPSADMPGWIEINIGRAWARYGA